METLLRSFLVSGPCTKHASTWPFPLLGSFGAEGKKQGSVQRELVLTFREEKWKKKYFPVLREVKREKKLDFPFLGSEKREKISFPAFWEVEREILYGFPLFGKWKEKSLSVSRCLGSEKRKKYAVSWSLSREKWKVKCDKQTDGQTDGQLKLRRTYTLLLLNRKLFSKVGWLKSPIMFASI